MKIVCVILGTRGDFQPMIALALGLMKKGHEVVVCAPPENEELAKSYHCRFVSFGPEIKKAFKENPEKQKGGVSIKISPSEGKKIILDQINLLPDVIKGVDLILAAGIVIGVHTAADILKVPYRFVAFYPIILGATKEDPLKDRILFGLGRGVMNMMMKGYVNRARKKYGLQPVKDIWGHWLGNHVIMACDKEINAAPDHSSFPFTQTGFMLLKSVNGLPKNVEDFIISGKPPVYIGFGSNPITHAEKYLSIFEKVSLLTQQRLIISKGWAGFAGKSTDDILYVDEMPFDLLFPRLAAIVYHGGTGTMAAASRAGIPQAAFPFMADQFNNRKRIIELGLGPVTCDFCKISAEAISSSIHECISNEAYKKNAMIMAQKLQKIDGVEMTVQYIEKEFLDLNRA